MHASGIPVSVVLLAGGRGERFWPVSTPELPKQFLHITGDKSLLRSTFERIADLVPANAIYVVTGAAFRELTLSELPELPEENVILEPEGRDTAASLGLAALWLERLHPDSIMVALPADHFVSGEDKFKATLLAAIEAAATGVLVTLGVHPVRAETGYGYIQVGQVLTERRGHAVHRVLRFIEKPDSAQAQELLASGDHLWNSGMFVWRVSVLRQEIARHLPELDAVLHTLERETDLKALTAALPHTFVKAPKISIDYGVMEKSDKVCVVPAYFGWDDVGSWTVLERFRPRDSQENCLTGNVITHECRNVIVEGGSRLVATVGVSDLIVVDTEAALLICHKSRAQDVKKIASHASSLGSGGPSNTLSVTPQGRLQETLWGREVEWAATDQYSARLLHVRIGQTLDLAEPQFQGGTLWIQTGSGRLDLRDHSDDLRPGTVLRIANEPEIKLIAVTDLTLMLVNAGVNTTGASAEPAFKGSARLQYSITHTNGKG